MTEYARLLQHLTGRVDDTQLAATAAQLLLLLLLVIVVVPFGRAALRPLATAAQAHRLEVGAAEVAQRVIERLECVVVEFDQVRATQVEQA